MMNVEIKARCLDLRRAESIARREVQAERFGRLRQVDTYFEVSSGRLKLRHIRQYAPHPESGVTESYEFISYQRRDEAGAARQRVPDSPRAGRARGAIQFFGGGVGVKARAQKHRKALFARQSAHSPRPCARVRARSWSWNSRRRSRSRSEWENCRQRVQELLGLFGIPPRTSSPSPTPI